MLILFFTSMFRGKGTLYFMQGSVRVFSTSVFTGGGGIVVVPTYLG